MLLTPKTVPQKALKSRLYVIEREATHWQQQVTSEELNTA